MGVIARIDRMSPVHKGRRRESPFQGNLLSRSDGGQCMRELGTFDGFSLTLCDRDFC